MNYRKEIDGLRAIAVLPVIFFHAGFPGFDGGFIGVDIFFVISGFLITSIIYQEIAEGKFSIANFYERRARRILPALGFVLLVTTVCAFFLMPPDYLKAYAESVVAVVTFSSNIFFFLTNDYFSTLAEEKPLLHTWSLSVEEQFYIFYPVLLFLVWKWNRRLIVPTLLVSSVISLALAEFLAASGRVEANFYLIFSRSWELFAGGLLALLCSRGDTWLSRRWLRELGSMTGLLLIVYAIVFFDESVPFPSLYTLVPVGGTVLILFFANSNSLAGRLLSMRPVVLIGLISYSLYLWHQPIFAFLRLKTVGSPPPEMFALGIVCSLALAAFSYVYIEKPFRKRSFLNRRKVFFGSGAMLGIFFVVGVAGYVLEGIESRYPAASNYADTIQFSPKRAECHTEGEDYLPVANSCRYLGENINWAIFGDSHVVEPGYALAERLQESNQGLLHLSFSVCTPALLFEVDRPGCTKWFREGLAYLEEHAEIENVLLGFRSTSFLYGHQEAYYPQIPNEDPAAYFRGLADGVDARALYWESLDAVINRLLASGKRVFLLYPIPELPINIKKAVMPFSIIGNRNMLDLSRATSAEYYLRRNAFILGKLDSLTYTDKLIAIKPFDLLCNGNYCPAVMGDAALYFDDDHLSISGGMIIANKIMESVGSIKLPSI